MLVKKKIQKWPDARVKEVSKISLGPDARVKEVWKISLFQLWKNPTVSRQGEEGRNHCQNSAEKF